MLVGAYEDFHSMICYFLLQIADQYTIKLISLAVYVIGMAIKASTYGG